MSTSETIAAGDELWVDDAEAAPEPEPAQANRSWFKRSAPMAFFLGQRILSSLVVLLGASFIVFMLLSYAMDPLEDLRMSTDPNRDQMIADRIRHMNLDTAAPIRYFLWLGNLLTGNLGTSYATGEAVSAILGRAIPNTLLLVTASTVLAILLGVTVGIVSALRQYTRFDYGVTFISFVLFSLPSFWLAVLLKVWGAIGFNNFLAEPHISPIALVVITLVSAVLWSAIIGGTRRTRLITFVGSGVVTLLMLLLVSMTSWLRYPRLGFIGVAVLAGITAFCLTALMAGMQNRKALFAALTTAGIGVAVMWPLQWVFQPSWMEMIVGPVGPIHFQMTPWGTLALLALSAVVVGCLVGWLYGGFDRKVSMRISALTALIVGLFIFADRLLQSWPHYLGMGRVRAPISTIGSSTPGLSGDPAYNFWTSTLDVASHLILPTITLMLITFAGYTRYARSSLLEVMNQDYVRTARAKGLPERVVTMRHAFRNALIPLATLIPLDFAFMFSGAIITEQIFGWRAMGSVFINGLRAMDAPPVMAHFIVVGSLALVATIVIDLIYAALDPRIRVNA